MLTPEVMGLLLLGLAWVTALLVALDALIDARAMWKRLGEWKTSLLQGQVVAPELAVHEVEQRVKLLDGDEPALVFFDRKHVSTVLGGAVKFADATLEVSGAPGAEVWIDEDAMQAAADCPSTSAFESLATGARGAGGTVRTVRNSVRAGAKVWLAGKKQGSKLVIDLLATFDPRAWAKRRLLAIAGVIVLDLGWVSLGTVVALWPPVFGVVSIAGASILMGHFLGMTALAMAARERSRTPGVACLRGVWRRDALESASPVSLSQSRSDVS